ncbi:nuclear autoantigenic sperm protein-like [Macrobrachium nipponense]|uniref:nuclear autoantigenic sperm protein-like n=1 Tax=Macrobrachium nipponense TaxID=159736 RepID=UPI0030C8B36F
MPETPEKPSAAAAVVSSSTSSPKTSPSKKEIDAATMALNHFAQGKRHLIVGDIPSAVNSLQEACKLLADQYGETAPECGDAYFCYGKALLEMARMESGVIGNALEGVPKEEDAEKSEAKKPEGPKEEGSVENDDEDSEGDGDSQEGEGEGEGDGESQDGEEQEGEAQEGENEGEGDKTEEDEEEVSNLQLSWEMLELAKIIFEKQTDTNPKMKEKVAEVFLKLGEVGLESENYTQGIEDFKRCLEIQTSVLNSDDRFIAETQYQLGIAFSFVDEFDLAIESFKAAVTVLECRISNLEKMKKEKAEWTEEQRVKDAATRVDPFYTEQGEIDELNQLLPEIKEKIVDMEQMKKDSHERVKAAAAMELGKLTGESSQGSSSSQNPFSGPSTSSNKEAKPIMVVRKKQRKLEEGESEDSKKIKCENGDSASVVNGSKMTNGQTSNAVTERKEASDDVAAELKDKSSETVKKVELKSLS